MRPITDQTIQELEGVDYGKPTYNSFVVTNAHRLRRVPLKRFALDDLRFMIGQGEGLPWLMPRALAHLARHPLAGGRWHYRGSLLNAVISVPDAFWAAQPLWRAQVGVVIASAMKRIHKVDVPDDFETELRAAMPRFA